MSDRVIEVKGVSKQYRLGTVGTGTLSHDLNRWWARVRGKEDPYSRVGQVNKRDQQAESDYVWALKDINFDVHRGEILGIIGANGAGKSTLLKLMSRITSPTTGHIRSKGRIASLLEVGTGMHPEMTARENIYLNGSIMGMRRHEITRKFDDIIDFAGCQMYVDTPVKRFSSGMKVRLGFAVAAFLEPEILIVDEVLAVGDAEFQRKCLGKMQDITESGGRTVLFVSHNMGAVQSLCSRCLVMETGEIAADTTTEYAIARYCELVVRDNCVPIHDRKDRTGTGELQLSSIRLLNSRSQSRAVVATGDDWEFELNYRGSGRISRPNIGIVITSTTGQRIARVMSSESPVEIPHLFDGNVVRMRLKSINLLPAEYQITAFVDSLTFNSVDYIHNAMPIEVIPEEGSLVAKVSDGRRSRTFCFYDCEWEVADPPQSMIHLSEQTEVSTCWQSHRR